MCIYIYILYTCIQGFVRSQRHFEPTEHEKNYEANTFKNNLLFIDVFRKTGCQATKLKKQKLRGQTTIEKTQGASPRSQQSSMFDFQSRYLQFYFIEM